MSEREGYDWVTATCGCYAEWTGAEWCVAASSFLCDHKQGDRLTEAPPDEHKTWLPTERGATHGVAGNDLVITAGRGRGRGKPPDSSSGSTPDPAHTSIEEDGMRVSEKAQLALDDLIEVWKKETPSAVVSQAAISRLKSAIDDMDGLEEWVASQRGRCVHYHGGGSRCECGFLPNVQANASSGDTETGR